MTDWLHIDREVILSVDAFFVNCLASHVHVQLQLPTSDTQPIASLVELDCVLQRDPSPEGTLVVLTAYWTGVFRARSLQHRLQALSKPLL